MKNVKKILTLLVAFAMTLCVFAMAACDPTTDGGNDAHVCEHVCETCGKCTDNECDDPVCENKCEGHTVVEPKHECKDVCETCGGCLTDCTETECATKCPKNHDVEPPKHECKDVCETCGGCLTECTETECATKCPKNHDVVPPEHKCEHKCEVEGCGGCLTECNDPACQEKCPGNHQPEPEHECQHKCEEPECGLCTSECEEPECASKCPGHDEPVPVYTITLVVGDGTLPEGAKTEYKTTADGKLDIDGYLPEPTPKAHWSFDDWYTQATGGTAVVEDETVFTQDCSIYARYIRDNGVWKDNGETWVVALSRNTGNASQVEYWLGGEDATVSLKSGDMLNLYINGKLCTGIWITGLGVKTEVQPKPSVIEVIKDGDYKIFLKDYSGGAGTDYVVEFRTNTEGQAGSEDDIPVDAGKITIKIGTLEDITIYLVKANGTAVKESEFSNYCIYTFNGEIFGNWATSQTKGVVSATMTASGSAVPGGWIIRWGASSYGSQTANIEGVIKAGGTYVIKLPANSGGAAEVTVIS